MQELIFLADLLDEFSTKKDDPVQEAAKSSELGRMQEDNHDFNIPNSAVADFSKQLQEDMAALMGDVNESSQMKREIETMMQNLGSATDLNGELAHRNLTSPISASSSSGKPFQETIRKTMERIQASGEQAATATTPEDSNEVLFQMLQEIQGGSLEGAENEEDFSKMLMGMMEQLTNKDILFEPMKELHDKFPAWMQKNESSIREDDLKRYRHQQRVVGEIVAKFNEQGYLDSNPKDREYIVDRMQQVR